MLRPASRSPRRAVSIFSGVTLLLIAAIPAGAVVRAATVQVTHTGVVVPAHHVVLRANLATTLSGSVDNVITTRIDPAKVILTSAADVTIPAGWNASYSTDGTNFTTVTPSTAIEWAAVRAIRASGTIHTDGLRRGLQMVSVQQSSSVPPSSSFKGSSATGDGWSVNFDDRGVIFNLIHHNGRDGVSMQSLDCHWRTGRSCGADYPFDLRPYVTFQRSPGWLDQVHHHLWWNTATAVGSGFGCIDVSVIAHPLFCSGKKTADVQRPDNSFLNLLPHAGLIENSDITAVDGKIYSVDRRTGVIECADPLANSGLGAACVNQPFTLAGLTHTHGYVSRTDQYFGKLIIAVEPHAFCFDPTTESACSGTWPVVIHGGSRVIYPLPNAAGVVSTICFAEWTANTTACTDVTGRMVPVDAKFKAIYTSEIGRYGAVWTATDPLNVGSKIYAPSGDWLDTSANILCYDMATHALCPNWPAKAKTYSLTLDPQNSNCIWTNGDDGVIRAFDVHTAREGCVTAPSTNVVTTQGKYPVWACGGEPNIQGWEAVAITSPSPIDYVSAHVSVADSAGHPIAGFQEIPITVVNGQREALLANLTVQQTGQAPRFTVHFAGMVATEVATVKVIALLTPPEMCVTPQATSHCASLSGQGLLPRSAGWNTLVTAEGIATLGTRTITSADQVSVVMASQPSEDCGARITGQATLGSDPVSGATVELLDQSGAPVTDAHGSPVTTSTNATGHYSFPLLIPGNYGVRFHSTSSEKAASATVAAGGSGTSQAVSSLVMSNPATVAAGADGIINASYVRPASAPNLEETIAAGTVAYFDPFSLASASTNATWSGRQIALCHGVSTCGFASLAIPQQGTWAVEPDGRVSFTPLAGFLGTASPLTYMVTDSLGQTAQGVLTPTVTATGLPKTGIDSQLLLATALTSLLLGGCLLRSARRRRL